MALIILNKSILSGARKNAYPPVTPLRDCRIPSLESRWRDLARNWFDLHVRQQVAPNGHTCRGNSLRILPAEQAPVLPGHRPESTAQAKMFYGSKRHPSATRVDQLLHSRAKGLRN